MPPLSEADKNLLARQNLDFCEALLRSAYGPNGAEIAGAVLAAAIRNFDPSEGLRFQQCLLRGLRRYATAEFRSMNGRNGAKLGPKTVSLEALNEKYSRNREFTKGDKVPSVISQLGIVDDPSAAIVREESIGEALQAFDAMKSGIERWRVLGRYLGELSNPEVQRIYTLKFETQDDLLDAMILAGAAVSRGSAEDVRLVATRSLPYWPVLAWLVVLAEAHDIPMRAVLVNAECVSYRSKMTRFFLPALRRWYGQGTPQSFAPDFKLGPMAAAFWLCRALVKRKDEGDIILSDPAASAAMGRRLMRSLREYTQARFTCETRNEKVMLIARQRERPAVIAFVSKFVPPAIWKNCGKEPCNE